LLFIKADSFWRQTCKFRQFCGLLRTATFEKQGGACVLRGRAWVFVLCLSIGWAGHAQDPSPAADDKPDVESQGQDSNLIRNVFDLFNMAGTERAKDFRPLTQAERNHLFLRSMVNPLSFVRVAGSAGIDQAKDKPDEWQQGASGYGKRYANIFAQYSIQRTVTYAMSSALHEDNRYFNSGKREFWPRTGYALSSAILARRDDGRRRFSFSQAGGVAAGAFLARTWLPLSQSSLGDAATSFAITTGTNVGFGLVKEFLPDVIRPWLKKRRQ
jgi:hypothetical protein